MRKHTESPWVVSSYWPANSRDNDFPGVGISIPDKTLVKGVHEDAIEVWGSNCEGNALLIAAAPDLLEALEQAVTSMQDSGYPNSHLAVRAAREAIAKAKGEQQ